MPYYGDHNAGLGHTHTHTAHTQGSEYVREYVREYVCEYAASMPARV